MKGTIIEKKKKYWIVLDETGRFRKLPFYHTLGLETGDEVELPSKTRSFNWRSATSIALIMIFMASGWLYMTPFGFMVVDINPSTELVYNRFERVIGVNLLNEDAKIMKSLNLKHRKLQTAVTQIVEEANEQGFLPDEGFVLLTNRDMRNAVNEEAFVEQLYEQLLKDGLDLTIAALESSEEEYEGAKGIGVSPGKEILRKEILSQKGEIKASGGSVGALIREVNQLTKPTKEEKEEARLIMQEQKREKIRVEEKVPPGQSKREEKQNANGQKPDKGKNNQGNSQGNGNKDNQEALGNGIDQEDHENPYDQTGENGDGMEKQAEKDSGSSEKQSGNDSGNQGR